jgi:hypothetical protein
LLPLFKSTAVFELLKLPALVHKKSESRPSAGASQFLNSGGKFSLAPGFSPVMMVEKRREAVLTAFRCAGKPVETGFILVTTNFTRLKPGANERRSKTEKPST